MSANVETDMFAEFEKRLGRAKLEKRLRAQVEHAGMVYAKARGGLHLEHAESFGATVKSILHLSGMLGLGNKNALDIQLTQRDVTLQNLPKVFEGFRILHLSDIHLDGFLDDCVSLRWALGNVQFDACVITGDFRFLTMGPHAEAVTRMQGVMDLLQCEYGVTGILGNHDYLEFVPELERIGMTMLINESVSWEKSDERLMVCGVDDPHFYQTDDLESALFHVLESDVVVLLAHSPELYAQAAANNIALYLCGHTHGGQICLPGGIPLITNADCPRRMVSGAWSYGEMQGYTSRGTGSSGVQARFFCPPEITVHTLRGA